MVSRAPFPGRVRSGFGVNRENLEKGRVGMNFYKEHARPDLSL